MKYAREIKVGVLAAICIFLLFFGFNFLKGVNIFSSMYAFHGVYTNIHGLQEQAPVYMRGYKVGQVDQIHYDFAKDSAFVVDISIQRDINLPKGTEMLLVADGLLGGMAIELRLPTAYETTSYESGAMLPTRYVPGLLDDLQVNLLASLENAINGVDSLVVNINSQLSNNHLAQTLENVEHISEDLSSVSGNLKGMMANRVPSIVANADSTMNSLRAVTADLQSIDFVGMAGKIDSTIETVNLVVTDLRSEDGTIGLLLRDSSLYHNIDATVISADSLLTDLKANPKRYVHFSLFGQKDKKNKQNKQK